MTGTSQTLETSPLTPVILPAEKARARVDREVFCKDRRPGCSTQFHDVIYVTGQRRFWLLPKRLAEQLKESASLLKEKTVNTDQATRLSNIADAGLLDYFLTPGPEAFLESSDGETGERERYHQSQAAIAEDKIKAVQCRQAWFTAKAAGDSKAQMTAQRDLFEAQQRIKHHEETMAQLEKISEQRAEALGYKREKGVFYTPRALQARDAMDRYLTEREKFKAEGFMAFDFSTNTEATIWQLIRNHKALHEKLSHAAVVDPSALAAVQTAGRILETKVKPYAEAILELAEYGIAVPEFALSPDDVYQGAERIEAYYKLLTDRAKLEQAIEGQYREWVSATAGKAAPPGALFGSLQSQWHSINAQAERLREHAETTVRQLLPPRLFVWEPERYQPKPLERLAKANFPLREISSASSTSALNHFSLKYLARQTGGALAEALNDLKALPKPVSKTADEDRAFSDWLKAGGAYALDEKGPWFDSQGLFLPELFFAELAKGGFTVETLQACATRERWGENLKAMIFEDKQLRNLMLFDNSPQAQFMRCLLPEGNIQTSVSMAGPKWHKGLHLLGADVQLEVAAWRGEVSLLNLELPKRENAQSLRVDYTAYDGSIRTLDFGKLSLKLSAKAWGFAGASMMLARSLTLDQATGYTSIAGIDRAQRSGEAAKFDLFIGAQAGCKVVGELSWCPPQSVLPPAPIPNRPVATPWRTLARLEVEVVVGAGAAISGNLMLRLQDGRLLLSIKAGLIVGAGVKGYMTFDVGYESIVALSELVRKEMAANRYKDLDWVDGEALAYIRDLSFLGAVGIDVTFIYIRGYSVVKAIYDALNDGGRGGMIAYTLMQKENYDVMWKWVVDLQPQAFGPLLLALSNKPRAFTVNVSSDTIYFEADDAHVLQQHAIERCLQWISQKPDAIRQFEDTVICMNRDGIRPDDPELTYCTNKYNLDVFMNERVKALFGKNERVRARYRECTYRLGKRLSQHCSYREKYEGPAFAPFRKIVIKYKGPKND